MDTKSKSTYIIAAITLIILLAAIYFLFIYRKSPAQIKPKEIGSTEVKELSEIDLASRPFVTLTPTSDGAEIIMSIENMETFDRIEYELTYQADNPTSPGDKIQRGATGTDVNTTDSKYKKSILLGTASRGVKSPDRGIEDGRLTMHLYKGDQEYLSETLWDLVYTGAKATTIEDSLQNFRLNIPSLGKDYWIIIADTVGVPPKEASFDIENVILPVYGTFSIAPDFTKNTLVSIKIEKDSNKAQILAFNHQDNTWQDLGTKFEASSKTASANTNKFATFVVVSSK